MPNVTHTCVWCDEEAVEIVDHMPLCREHLRAEVEAELEDSDGEPWGV
jgi:hypothetical protein